MYPDETIVWHEGLLMAPQHMQVQAHYHDQALHRRIHALTPHAWGVVDLAFDDAALHQGQLSLPEGFVILPSGLPIGWQAPLCRQLSHAAKHIATLPMATDGSRHIDVFVAVARPRDGLTNVATDQAAKTHQRFVSHNRIIAEQTFGQTPPVDVLVCVPHVQLLFAHELEKDLESIHIATLTLSADGVWQRAVAFTPPALRLHHHSVYLARLRHVLPRLQQHISALLPAANNGSRQHALGMRMSDIDDMMQLRALQQLVPLIACIIDDTHITPREAYFLLKQALAMGGCFQKTRHTPSPVYHHADQASWLMPMLAQLEAMTPPPRVKTRVLSMVKNTAGHWHIALPESSLDAEAAFILALRCDSGADRDEVTSCWTRQAKFAAPEALPKLLRSALGGIDLQQLTLLPSGMHAEADTVYLQLDTSHQGWQAAVHAGVLAVAPPRGLDDMAQARMLCVAPHTPDAMAS